MRMSRPGGHFRDGESKGILAIQEGKIRALGNITIYVGIACFRDGSAI